MTQAQLPFVFLFDVDGVLLRNDGWSKHIERDLGVASAHLQEFFERDFEACLEGRADLKTALAPWLAKWKFRGSADDFLTYWFEHDAILNDGVLQLATKFAVKHACYLATNQEKHRARYLMETLQFQNIFRNIFAACDIGAAKPRDDFFRSVDVKLRSLHDGLRSENTFFIDDSKRNVEAAKRLGWRVHHYTATDSLAAWLATV